MNKKASQIFASPNNEYQDIEWLFEELLVDEGKNIHICNPLDEEARKELLDAVLNLKCVSDKTSAFNYPISSESMATVLQLVNMLEDELKERLNSVLLNFMEENKMSIKKITTLDGCCKVFDQLNKSIIGDNDDVTVNDFILNLTSLEPSVKLKKDFNEIEDMVSEIEALNLFINKSEDIFVEKALISLLNSFIYDQKEEVVEIKNEIYVNMLEKIFTSYEIQSHVYDDVIREKYNNLVSKKDYTYTTEDFSEILSLLDISSQDEMKECLKHLIANEKGNKKITQILRTYIKDAIEVTYVNDELIIYTNAQNMVISTVLRVISNMTNTKTAKAIWFIANDSIYINENIGMQYVGGKNVVIACKDLIVSSNAKINVSGESVDSNIVPDCGMCGLRGESAGNVALYILGEIKGYQLTVVANGGNGGRGGNGKKGEKGKNGENGRDAGYTHSFGGALFKGVFAKGEAGSPGEEGKPGKDAGCGGYGGLKGQLRIYPKAKSNQLLSKINLTTKDGEDGMNGIPGIGGEGGQGGYNGYNTLSFSPSGIDKTRYFTGYFTNWDYKVKFVSYTLSFSGGSYVEGKVGPHRTYARCGNNGPVGKINMNRQDRAPVITEIQENVIKDVYLKYKG